MLALGLGKHARLGHVSDAEEHERVEHRANRRPRPPEKGGERRDAPPEHLLAGVVRVTAKVPHSSVEERKLLLALLLAQRIVRHELIELAVCRVCDGEPSCAAKECTRVAKAPRLGREQHHIVRHHKPDEKNLLREVSEGKRDQPPERAPLVPHLGKAPVLAGAKTELLPPKVRVREAHGPEHQQKQSIENPRVRQRSDRGNLRMHRQERHAERGAERPVRINEPGRALDKRHQPEEHAHIEQKNNREQSKRMQRRRLAKELGIRRADASCNSALRPCSERKVDRARLALAARRHGAREQNRRQRNGEDERKVERVAFARVAR
eukprot:Amastigsp_a685827_81.p2 type:complete len:323 gc:universal Amastigsp_a685827_81:1014-46(-)